MKNVYKILFVLLMVFVLFVMEGCASNGDFENCIKSCQSQIGVSEITHNQCEGVCGNSCYAINIDNTLAYQLGVDLARLRC